MGLIEILVKRELTLECLQLSSINPFLKNACMPTLKCKLNEVLKISCMSDNMDISKMGPILPHLPLYKHSCMNPYIKMSPPLSHLPQTKGKMIFIYSFNPDISIAPL